MGGEEVGKMNISSYRNAWDSQVEGRSKAGPAGGDVEGEFYLI